MSLNERFTDDEILLLNSTPTLVGSAMVFAEGSGLGTLKEMMANAKSYIGGAQAYPNNPIITGIVPNLVDHKEGLEQAKAFRDKAIARFKEKGIDSKEAIRGLLLEDCKAVAQLLANKASELEAKEYKQWVMSIAETIAKSAKEGGFLGFGGEVISENEKEIFTEIAKALGIPAVLA
jgi:hypothetical protein